MLRKLRVIGAALLFGCWALSAHAAPMEYTPIKVRPGDTLWSIARKYLKDPKRWNEIVKHNRKLLKETRDPTVALPGMTLRVPTGLLKQKYRAARLVQAIRRVLSRKKETTAWKGIDKGDLLYDGDGLRTLAKSFARVRFFGGAMLNLDPNSIAILKSPKTSDHDLRLKRGAIHTSDARVVTPTAIITPKRRGTKYSARVMDDLTTRVQVYKGVTDVQDLKGLRSVEVKAGFKTDVRLKELPSRPVKMPEWELRMEAKVGSVQVTAMNPGGIRAAPSGRLPNANLEGVDALAADMKQLSVGIPVAAYRVQIARDKRFRRVVWTNLFDPDEPFDLGRAGLAPGTYYTRAAIIDLLGEQQEYSKPRPYRVGGGGGGGAAPAPAAAGLSVTRPARARLTVRTSKYRIMGKAESDLQVTINGRRVPTDESGAFSYQVKLKRGANEFRIVATDLRGNEKVIRRTLTYSPY